MEPDIMKKTTSLFLATLGFIPLAAHAFPIAIAGTEGLNVLVAGSPIIATYQGNSASYSNDLYLMLDSNGHSADDGNLANDLFIFNNHASAVGSTVNLGSYALGSELMFRLFVNNTGDNFFTGAASRNPDSHTHARVQAGWMPNETLVSFEDLNRGPYNYNDLSFSFTNTAASPGSAIPEPASLAIFGIGLVGLGFMRRSKRAAR
jgi:hypothetical protein